MDAPWVSDFWLNKVTKYWWTEIDIAENCPCNEKQRHDINSNVHVFRSPIVHGGVTKLISSPKKYFPPFELQKNYHVWGLEWNKDVIRFFIDGVMFREVKNVHWYQPLQINLNNESNKWFGALPDESLPNARTDKEYLTKNNQWNSASSWAGNAPILATLIKEYSPVNLLTANSPPVLSIHGVDDKVVPIEQSISLHNKLDSVGIENKLLSLPQDRHLGFTDEQFQLIFSETFTFLDGKVAEESVK